MIQIHLCVNDHRNGMFNGRIMGVSLNDSEELTLASPYLNRGLKCEVTDDRIRVGKSREWPIFGEHEWVGNWCWNAYAMRPADAADLINFAISKGFCTEVASEPLFEKIQRGEQVTAADLKGQAT